MDLLTPEPDSHLETDPLLIDQTTTDCNNKFDLDLSAQLSALMKGIGLGHFAGIECKENALLGIKFFLFLLTELFQKEQIDIKAFATLDDDGLLKKGIGSKGVRKKMLRAMKGFSDSLFVVLICN